MLGNNMFAYCRNTPINGCDPCGTCFHRWDFWNDCEKCGGETINDKWNAIMAWCIDMYSAANSVYQQQILTNSRITAQQVELIETGVVFLYQSYTANNERQIIVEQQIATEQINLIKAFMESDAYDLTTHSQKMISGGSSIVKGIGLILAPIPTPADDLIGIRQITYGIIKCVVGFGGFLGEVLY